jgi:RND family efflux transporter MFP subunit
MEYIKKHKTILVLLILIPLVIFVGQKLLSSDSTNTSIKQTLQETVKKGDITASISASGQIETANYLPITTSVNGIVKKVYVKEGDSVSKGQKIMDITLDSEGELSLASAYSAYLKAKNSLDSAKNALYALESTKIQKEDAFNTLKKTNTYQSHDERTAFKLAENDYQKAKNDYDQQASTITQMQIALSSALNEYQSQSPTITSPAAGVVANIVSVEGTKIENSVSERSIATVASIKQPGTPIASLNVSELDINKVKVGQKVVLKLNSDTENTFSGVVAGIDKIGTQTNGVSNYPVIIKFDKENEEALPNMGVEADIITDSKTGVLYVPSAAIKTAQGSNYVIDASGNRKPVKTGVADNTNTEITDGLVEGDVILVESLPTSGFTSTTQNSTRGFGAVGVFQGR